MNLPEYLGDKMTKVATHGISMLSLSAFLLLTGTRWGVVTLLLIVWVVGLTASLLLNFYRVKSYLQQLESILNGLDKKYLFMECVEKPKSAQERKLFSLVRRSAKSMIEAVSDAQNQQAEYREYIEDWVHEVKAPITAAQLVCNNNKSESTRKILVQLAQIEEHVERALYYARADSFEKDFVVRATSLADIAGATLSRHQTLLIQHGVNVETSGLDVTVYTDGKWASFMLGQFLSNAVRYRGDSPTICLEARQEGESVRFDVTDNGIGIPSDELPRVFERGFTGSNGRATGQSTGMGLYICKKLAHFLQVELTVEAVPNEYTSIHMTFPAQTHGTKK